MSIFSTYSVNAAEGNFEPNHVYDRSDFIQRQPQPVPGKAGAVRR